MPEEQPKNDRDVMLAHLSNRIDELIAVTKKSSRMTITDGIALGFGMFVALPLILGILWLLLLASGFSIGSLFQK